MIDKIITTKSSSIKEVTYDDDLMELTVTFKTGGSYRYSDVPKNIFDSFRSVPSAGKFFHNNIKDKYRYVKK